MSHISQCQGCHQEAMAAKGVRYRMPIMHTCGKAKVGSLKNVWTGDLVDGWLRDRLAANQRAGEQSKPSRNTGIVLCSIEMLSEPAVFVWLFQTFRLIDNLTTVSDEPHLRRLLLYSPLFTAGEVQYELMVQVKHDGSFAVQSLTPVSQPTQ